MNGYRRRKQEFYEHGQGALSRHLEWQKQDQEIKRRHVVHRPVSKPVLPGPGASRAVYQILPSPADGVEVVYTRDPVEAQAWLKNNVIDGEATAIGFDIEWKPQFVKKIHGGVENKTSVMQLAVENSCLVLHIHHMRTLPKLLGSVLKDKNIKKVGSGILEDIVKLRRDKNIQCEGSADTQVLAQTLGFSRSDGLGLKALAKNLLGIELNKSKRVSMSNWECFPLSYIQIEYAAMDAWMGLRLYTSLKQLASEKGISTEPVDDSVLEGNSGHGSISTSPTKGYACSVCGKRCAEKDALLQHTRAKHVSCTTCGMLFQYSLPKDHKRCCSEVGLERNEISPSGETKTPAEIVICQVCGKKCKGEGALADHLRKAAHVSCEDCGEMFPQVVSSKHKRFCARKQALAKVLGTTKKTKYLAGEKDDEIIFIKEIKREWET